jgi:Fe2+ or Zn2+ uptake regulation protein
MSKKGLSTEEKRKRMLDFFFEKQDFFQLKDIEKLCSQEKGIVLNTIKDILTSLVDDGLVDSEKIGTSLYYWSLPSKALKKREQMVQKAEQELAAEQSRNVELTQRLESSSNTVDDEEKRSELENRLEELLREKESLLKELDMYKENDPAAYDHMKEGVVICKKACNRWIENIFSVKSWLKNKFRCDESMIDKQFEIPSDLDYIS